MRVPLDHWYPLLESRELGRRPLGLERLGRRFVFWRTADGRAHAHDERCPHLGAALSGGTVCDDRLVCPFHGFAFDSGGACRVLPASGRDGTIPQGLAVTSYPVCERHGFVWLWWGARRETVPEPPYFPEFDDAGWRSTTSRVDWPVHYTRAIENQLDVAHLAIVHRTTIGRGGQTRVHGPHVEADATGIKVWTTNTRDDGTPAPSREALAAEAAKRPPTLHFLFPGLWRLTISDSLKNVIAFVPINERLTRYYLRLYHRHRNPLVAKPFEWAMAVSNRFILDQDRRVVVTQTPAVSLDATDDRLVAADRAIVAFRRQLRELLDAR
ncbi:MAG: aromatic ring-hydroxylating dioxygenase subunit alpha [Proteobacteria bacterium]|nr:aromatic ring-hydroxylating dioxygenase subunit alpha [Pseudomonadota bacterium]